MLTSRHFSAFPACIKGAVLRKVRRRGILEDMSKVVTATYDAKHNMLRLDEPLEGVRDHEMLWVIVSRKETEKVASSSMALHGILSKEAGDELAQAINELFPPWDE
jgi:predicted HAD superfamily phosphohydrolase YqeG